MMKLQNDRRNRYAKIKISLKYRLPRLIDKL